MLKITYVTHATSLDNEARVASGHYDVDLSSLGEAQAAEMGARMADVAFDAIYHSDQLRAMRTAEIAFATSEIPRHISTALRECDYGDLTRQPNQVINQTRHHYVTKPYPNGQGYAETTDRLYELLKDIAAKYGPDADILIIGNRAVQYGLEHLCHQTPLVEAVQVKLAWQPSWHYSIDII